MTTAKKKISTKKKLIPDQFNKRKKMGKKKLPTSKLEKVEAWPTISVLYPNHV